MEILEGELLKRWNDLLSTLSVGPSRIDNLAGLFRGHIPEGYAEKSERVLYIGKATAGPFLGENESEEAFNRTTAGFWSFARSISQCAGEESGDLSNLVWSNLCKIGVSNGNPKDDLSEKQLSLAVETLRHEVAFLKPSLVVCVAEGFQDHYVYQMLGVEQGRNDGFAWRKSGKYYIYFRSAMDGWPPILWMKHPQLKKSAYLNEALSIAEDLLKGKPVGGDTSA